MGGLSLMSRIGHNFRAAEDLPIPEDVQPNDSWTESMWEMSAHIGPYRTILLVDRFAGRKIYIPADWTRGKTYEGVGSIRDVVGDDGARILSDVYRTEYLIIPTAKAALASARRAAVIARIRSNELSVTAGASLLGTSRTYLSELVNHSDEGLIEGQPRHARLGRAPGQMDLFGDD